MSHRSITQFQLDMCRFLGIEPDNTRAFTLTVEAGEMPRLSVERFAIADGDVEFTATDYRIELVPLDDETDAA